MGRGSLRGRGERREKNRTKGRLGQLRNSTSAKEEEKSKSTTPTTANATRLIGGIKRKSTSDDVDGDVAGRESDAMRRGWRGEGCAG